MRKLIYVLLTLGLLASAQAPPTNCAREFYLISHSIHNPAERHQQLLRILSIYECTTYELNDIWNNLGSWVGSADSAELRQKLIHEHAKATLRESKK
jgi:hypothetical protein